MGIFNKTKSSMVASSQLTILAEGCTVKGDLSVEGNILVAGFMDGRVICQSSVSIGVTGAIRGSVKGRHLVVSGLMEGEVYAEMVEILAGGKVQGTIQTDQLIIERGGFFLGASAAVTATGEKRIPLPTETNRSVRALESKAPASPEPAPVHGEASSSPDKAVAEAKTSPASVSDAPKG
ncbi:polymer-forming cytoskeletal protein [Pseudomonas sp. ITA]|uniref:bactofilin family protein n=1 Tax=Pseudomonas sp. ITA TaxID=2825841 RepID=UPI0024994ECB|nr:polymer-forming cytoskeletal protein [Pseudomonas sp. ITA]MDI2145878.1 polymer-forming cytoskeletal protein [Pseudomonas sp. ITA]